jgi:hypothetical protein
MVITLPMMVAASFALTSVNYAMEEQIHSALYASLIISWLIILAIQHVLLDSGLMLMIELAMTVIRIARHVKDSPRNVYHATQDYTCTKTIL